MTSRAQSTAHGRGGRLQLPIATRELTCARETGGATRRDKRSETPITDCVTRGRGGPRL